MKGLFRSWNVLVLLLINFICLPALAFILSSTFHCSKKQSQFRTDPLSTELPETNEEGEILLWPSHILDYRQVTRGSRLVKEVKVQWQGLPIEEATWEPIVCLQRQFPELNLEDLVFPEGGENDRAYGLRQQKRRDYRKMHFGLGRD